MNTYNAHGLVHNTWPPLHQQADGRWKRVWTICLESHISPHLSMQTLSGKLSEPGFLVLVEPIGGCELAVTVVTKEHGWSDTFYFATYRMFGKIDAWMGTIESIEGQPKALWRPWRK